MGTRVSWWLSCMCATPCPWKGWCWCMDHPRWSPDPVLRLSVPPPSLQVSAYGFITANYEQFSDHYYELEKKPLVFYANHDMMLEAALWRSLHQAGIMTLYQR